jgi:hypothetical protein
VTLAEVSAANDAGQYRLAGGLNTTGWSLGSYTVTCLEVSTSLVANGPEFAVGELRVVTATASALSARLPATLSGGKMRSQVEGMDDDTLTAGAVAASAVAEVQSGLATASVLASVATDAGNAASRAADIQSRLPSALVSGKMPAHVETIATNAITADALAASATSEIQAGLATSSEVSALPSASANATAVWAAGTRTLTGIGGSGIASQSSVDSAAAGVSDVQARLPAALVDGKMPAHISSMGTNVVTEDALAASAVAEIQTGLATSSALSSAAADAALAASRAADLQGRVPGSLVGGRMDVSVGAMQTDVLTAAALAASATTEIQSGLATASAVSAVNTIAGEIKTAVTAVQADVDDVQTRLPASLVGGHMSARVESMATDVLTAAAVSAGAVGEIQSGLASASAIAALPTASSIVDALLDAPLAEHQTDGTAGAALGNHASPEEIAEAVWARVLSGTDPNTAGRFLKRLYQLGFNRLELSANGGGENVLFDDDGSTPMVAFDIRDHTGSAITPQAAAPARRSAGAAP